MSRWWNNPLAIAIFSDKIILLRLSSSWHPHVIRKEVVRYEANPTSLMSPALEAISDILRNKEWLHTKVSVIISQEFVRLALLTGELSFYSAQEELAFARHVLNDANGLLDGDWQISLSKLYPGRPRIACAVENSFMERLHQMIAQTENSLIAIKPFFSTVFDNYAKYLTKQNTWFAAIEHSRCVLMRLEAGTVRSVSSRRIFTSVETELPQLIAQEAMMLDENKQPTSIHIAAPGLQKFATPENLGARFLTRKSLPGLSALDAKEYAIALEVLI